MDLNHAVRALASFREADSIAPLFADMTLASAKVSSQSSQSVASSSRGKARQSSFHIPSAPHRRRRRQHDAGLGRSSGKSRQRAPALSTQRIPSSIARWCRHGRSRSGSILAHSSEYPLARMSGQGSHPPYSTNRRMHVS